ncbi:hypothetical protein IGJ48_001505 [Enterococcus pernyi]
MEFIFVFFYILTLIFIDKNIFGDNELLFYVWWSGLTAILHYIFARRELA